MMGDYTFLQEEERIESDFQLIHATAIYTLLKGIKNE